MMRKYIIVLFLCGILTVPFFGQTSPVKNASAGRFSSQIDSIVDVNSWSSAMNSNFFLFTQYSGTVAGNQLATVESYLPLNAGLGALFGDIYLGAYYAGQISSWEETSSNPIDSNGNFIQISTVAKSQHSVNMLLGWKNLGIRLGFAAGGDTKNGTFALTADGVGTPTLSNALIDYSPDGVINTRVYSPSLAIGANFKIGTITLRPNLVATVSYSPSNKFAKQTERASGTITTVEELNKSFTPDIALRLGLDLAQLGSAGVKYQIVYPFYIENTLVQKSGTQVNTTEKFKPVKLDHVITADYAYSHRVTEQFSFGVKGEVIVGLGSNNTNTLWRSVNGTVTNYGNDTLLETITVVPTLSLGSRYVIKPEKATWYVGITVVPTQYTGKKTTVRDIDSNNILTKKTTDVDNKWLSPSAFIGTGFTIQCTQNIGIDTSLLMDLNSSNGTLNGTVFGGKLWASLWVRL